MRAAPLPILGLTVFSMVSFGAACSDDGSGSRPIDSGDGGQPDVARSQPDASVALTALEILPDEAELQSSVGSAFDFSARGTFEDGTTADVTDQVGWLAAPVLLGKMDGARFTSEGLPGTAPVTARLGGLSATARVTVNLLAREIVPPEPGQPALPDDPETVFSEAPPSTEDPPTLIYPYDGVLLPRNLGEVDVHFEARGFELFEVSFRGDAVDVAFYTRCTELEGGCIFRLANELYQTIADASAGRGPVTVTVRGTDDDGTGVAASASIEVSFSARAVEGGLYYWAADAESIVRVDFGVGNQPEVYFPFEPSDTCFGCHALSPDGTRMSFSRNGQRNGQLYLLDVESGELLMAGDTGDKEQFQTWSPDSAFFAGIYGDDDRPDLHDAIRIRSADTGEVVETISLGHEPTHPDWSSSGDRIAYTRVTRHRTSQRPGRGGISFVEQLDDGWSESRSLIPPEDGFNYYNPAYAPGGEFMVYNRSVCPGGDNGDRLCDGDADPSAALFAIRSNGGDRVELARANAGGPADEGEVELTNTFPRWSPFEGPRRADGSGRIVWMTFSSRRRYGLYPLPDSGQSLPGQLMWMAAVDPDAVLRGEDGSFPAFALPFQDLSTSNHIGQWTREFVPTDPDPGNPGGGKPDAGVCAIFGQSCADDPGICCDGLLCITSVNGDVCLSNN